MFVLIRVQQKKYEGNAELFRASFTLSSSYSCVRPRFPIGTHCNILRYASAFPKDKQD